MSETIFNDGDSYFNSLKQEIENAKSSIFLETYIFQLDDLGLQSLDQLPLLEHGSHPEDVFGVLAKSSDAMESSIPAAMDSPADCAKLQLDIPLDASMPLEQGTTNGFSE